MIGKKNPMELSECCLEMCKTLNAVIQGRNADELNESTKVARMEIEKCVDHP